MHGNVMDIDLLVTEEAMIHQSILSSSVSVMPLYLALTHMHCELCFALGTETHRSWVAITMINQRICYDIDPDMQTYLSLNHMNIWAVTL